jgi:hypothetical protein
MWRELVLGIPKAGNELARSLSASTRYLQLHHDRVFLVQIAISHGLLQVAKRFLASPPFLLDSEAALQSFQGVQ